MLSVTLLTIILLASVGLLFNRHRARIKTGPGVRARSLPIHHGIFVALWVGVPSIVLTFVWLASQGPIIDRALMASLPEALVAGKAVGERALILSEIKSVAAGHLFGEPAPGIVEAALRYRHWQELARLAMFAAAMASALAGLALASRRVSPEFHARQGVERLMNAGMILCALLAILTTLGILMSLLIEAGRFFDRVPVLEFLFGLNWEPQIPTRADQVAGLGAFGAVPVFTGTLLIAFIAMAVATPIGLLAAIYLAEFATPTARTVIKPALEILAGIPTVVYGFFAVLTVSPALREFGAVIGLDIAPNSALAAGAVMGIMILPFISSLSDDALKAVPQAMRDGAYALGATQAETITMILLPAALPGIAGGMLLAVSRAIGETMIVVMAAGLIAKLTADPFEGVTTVTVQIVTLLIGDTEFDNPKTLAAFALGLVLFLATLMLNFAALRIVQKYREKYE